MNAVEEGIKHELLNKTFKELKDAKSAVFLEESFRE